MNRIYYILFACVFVMSACKTEIDKPYDDTNTMIVYDEYMEPLMNYGVYNYSNLDDQIQVKFGVDAAASTVLVSVMPQDGEYGAAKTVNVPTDKMCVVTYSRADLNWEGVEDEAMVKVTNAGVTKEIYLVSVSPWINLATYKAEGKVVSTITTAKSYAPIETKPVNDTIIFTANVDSWISVDGATWTMSYKKGKKGTAVTVTPVATSKKNSVKFANSMAALGLTSKDTLFVSATISNNGVSRTGSYTVLVKNISTALSSKVTNGVTFRPAVSKSVNDTINMQAVVIKSGTNRSWLKANSVTWTAAYTIGSSKTINNFGGTINTKLQNDTVSVAQIIGVLGQLPNVAQYDTVFMTGTMNINGLKYPMKQSYVVGK